MQEKLYDQLSIAEGTDLLNEPDRHGRAKKFNSHPIDKPLVIQSLFLLLKNKTEKGLYMRKNFLLGVVCSFGVFGNLFGIEAIAKEEIKERLKEITAAVKQHNSDALLSYWTKDAEWINPDTGKTVKGNGAIADSLLKRTQDIEEKQLHLKITLGNITFPASDQAVVEAIVDVRDANEKLVQQFTRKITLIKQEGKWYVKQVREVEISVAP